MRYVYQTKFGSRDGNCFAACIASLMDIPLNEVDVKVDGGAEEWFETVQAFLKPRNLFYLEIRLDVAVKYPLYAMDEIYCLMIGKSPRFDCLHCVVGQLNHEKEKNEIIYNMIHDPIPRSIPGERGLASLVALGFLAKLDWSKP